VIQAGADAVCRPICAGFATALRRISASRPAAEAPDALAISLIHLILLGN
jgi:hypothetical protein